MGSFPALSRILAKAWPEVPSSWDAPISARTTELHRNPKQHRGVGIHMSLEKGIGFIKYVVRGGKPHRV